MNHQQNLIPFRADRGATIRIGVKARRIGVRDAALRLERAICTVRQPAPDLPDNIVLAACDTVLAQCPGSTVWNMANELKKVMKN